MPRTGSIGTGNPSPKTGGINWPAGCNPAATEEAVWLLGVFQVIGST
jgi:hypothetical protein